MERIDDAWRRVVSDGEETHSTRVTAAGDVILRSLDWAWWSEDGIPDQSWATGLGPGEHTVAVTTEMTGAPTRLSLGGTTGILLVGDLHGDAPQWRRVEGDLPFRRGVAVSPDLGMNGGSGGATSSGTPWSEVLRGLETVTSLDGKKVHLAIEAFATPLLVAEHHGHRAVAATATAGLPSAEATDPVAYANLITHGWAERWEGLRDGRLVAIALDIGTGLRRTLDGLEAVVDPWAAPVGPALNCDPHAVGPEPEYGDPDDRMPYTEAFIPGKHPSDRAVTVSLGEVGFPSGVATVINPTAPEEATEVMLAFPTDRRMPCFVAPSLYSYGDLLMRTADTMPTHWRHAMVFGQRAPDGYYGRGLVALCDRAFAERIRADRGFAERVSELAFSLNPMVLHDPDSGLPIGVIIATEGEAIIRPLLGLDATGAVAAVAIEAGDAGDLGLLR